MAGLRVFRETSRAIQLFFELAGMLGLPDAIRNIYTPSPSQDEGRWVPSILILSGFAGTDEPLRSRFILESAKDEQLRLGKVILEGDPSDDWGPPSSGAAWRRDFLILNHEDGRLEFVAPGTVIGKAFSQMSATAKLAIRQRYFYTGVTPFIFPKE
ncbi:MAG: hypothetical protein Q8P13_01515 [bacterium]|nr:hypothetical protein [bacterium]